jgi:hypothetical protein
MGHNPSLNKLDATPHHLLADQLIIEVHNDRTSIITSLCSLGSSAQSCAKNGTAAPTLFHKFNNVDKSNRLEKPR